METIWKYAIPIPATMPVSFTHYMPPEAKILHVAPQGGDLCIWVQCTPCGQDEMEPRVFLAIGTGWELRTQCPGSSLKYIGTYPHSETWVIHVYEEG